MSFCTIFRPFPLNLFLKSELKLRAMAEFNCLQLNSMFTVWLEDTNIVFSSPMRGALKAGDLKSIECKDIS